MGTPRRRTGPRRIASWLAVVAAGLAAVVAAAPVARAAASPAPQRVMSLNLCADQLLLALLPPERIAGITWLSETEGDPALLPLVQRVPRNHGSAEEVLAARPDLVVAGRYTTGTTRRLLQAAGIPLLVIDPVQDWNEVRAVTRQVAAAVGREAEGERLLREMDATLADIAAGRPAVPVRAIGWGGGGSDVPGRDSLFNTLLTTAGAVNVAAPLRGRGSYDLEQVVLARPDVLLRGAAYASTPALRNEAAAHRLLQRLHPRGLLTYPEAVFGCGAPSAADATLRLQRQLQGATAAEAP